MEIIYHWLSSSESNADQGKAVKNEDHSQLLTLLPTTSLEAPAGAAQIIATPVPAAAGVWCNLACKLARFCSDGKSTDLCPCFEKELALFVVK